MPKNPDLFTAADELAQVLGPELAKDFVEHRKMLKKPMTGKAGALMAKKLRGMPDPVAAVEQSILKGWTDVWPVEQPSGSVGQFRSGNGVAAQREKLRQEIEQNGLHQGGEEGQNPGPAGRLSLLDWQGPDRPH